MDYVSFLQDSIDTSVSMKIFKNREDASFAHIFKSKLVQLKISELTDIYNFDKDRLQKSAVTAYPIHNRPRGNNDISSVKYYQKQIKQKNKVSPIWMIYKNNNYTLLDGAHRIVASYIEDEKYINAYIIFELLM